MFIHNISPVFVNVGHITIYWYGLMYLLSFIIGFYLFVKRNPDYSYKRAELLVQYVALGTLVGGRVGYIVLYDLHSFLHDPKILFMIWQGGMSFHGGLIGVLLAVWLFAKKSSEYYLSVIDRIAPIVPLGLFFGRLGNFINAEHYGHITELPWGIYFSKVDNFARHPSQLYEAFFEGIVLFIVLWFFSKKSRPRGHVAGVFLICYACARFICEYFRTPEVLNAWLDFLHLTSGQLLSVPMLLVGSYLLHRKN